MPTGLLGKAFALGELVAKLACPIGGAIIDENNFRIIKMLGQDTVDAAPQK